LIRPHWTANLLVAAGRRWRVVLIGTALVVVVGLAIASRLEFDPDVLRLLPRRDPAVQTYQQTLALFGSADVLVAGIRIPEGAPLDPYESFADALGERMQQSELFTSVEHHIGEPEELLREFLPRSLLFLDVKERQRVAALLSDRAIERRVQELRRQLETPQAVAIRDLLKLDPLGLSQVFVDRLGGRRGPLAIDWMSGRYLSRDHRLLLVLGKPVRSPQDLAFNRQLISTAQREAQAARADWSEMAEGLELAPPEVFWGGRYAIALDDSSLIWRDVGVNAATSVAGVLILFFLAYRRGSLLALVFLPLVCGLTVTFAFSALAVGRLASTTAGVAALLIGLGNDFVIVLYGRYVAERWRGADLEASLRAMGGGTARGVILGAVTTAATFFAFLITDFTGLYQMGLIVGTGILFCLVAVLLLVPAMLSWREESHRQRESRPRLSVFAFGGERLTHLAIRWPRSTLLVAVTLSLVALGLVPKLAFDDSVEALRPAGNRGILAQEEINSHFGSGFDHMSLVIRGDTLDEVLDLTDGAAERARRLVDDGRLGGYDAVTSVLPSPDGQKEALSWLAAGRADGSLDIERIRATFDRACTREGMRPGAFGEGLELLGQALSLAQPVTRAAIAELPQGAALLDRYLRETPEGWISLVKVYNLPGRPKREVPQVAVDLADTLGPHAELTGINVLSRSLRGDVRRDATVSALIGLVLVVILLGIDFRSIRTAVLALVPLALGLLWMLASSTATLRSGSARGASRWPRSRRPRAASSWRR